MERQRAKPERGEVGPRGVIVLPARASLGIWKTQLAQPGEREHGRLQTVTHRDPAGRRGGDHIPMIYHRWPAAALAAPLQNNRLALSVRPSLILVRRPAKRAGGFIDWSRLHLDSQR